MDIAGIQLDYVLAALTILAGLVIAFLFRRLVKWLESKAGETETYWDDILVAAIGTPVQVAIVIVSVYLGITWFDILPDSLQWIREPAYATAFFVLISAWIIST